MSVSPASFLESVGPLYPREGTHRASQTYRDVAVVCNLDLLLRLIEYAFHS